jgi:hypothetical protein
MTCRAFFVTFFLSITSSALILAAEQPPAHNQEIFEAIEQQLAIVQERGLDKQTIKLIQQTVDKHLTQKKSTHWLQKKRNLMLLLASVTITVAIAIPCSLYLAEKIRTKKLIKEQEALAVSITKSCDEKLNVLEKQMIGIMQQSTIKTDQNIAHLTKEIQTISSQVDQNIADCHQEIDLNKAEIKQTVLHLDQLDTQLGKYKQLSLQNFEKMKENMQIFAVQTEQKMANCMKTVEDNTAIAKEQKDKFVEGMFTFQKGLHQVFEVNTKAIDGCIGALLKTSSVDTSDLTPTVQDFFEGLNMVSKTVTILGGIATTIGNIESVVSGNNNCNRSALTDDDIGLQERFNKLRGNSPAPLTPVKIKVPTPTVKASKGWSLFNW